MPYGYRPKTFIDMTGKRYGKLTAIEYIGNKKWLFACDCGNTTKVKGMSLRLGWRDGWRYL
jgi:hypothetical protein